MGNGDGMSNLMTVREVAELLHVHPNTLRRWSNNGMLMTYRINSRGDRRYKREEIVRFLAELNGQTNDSQEIDRRQLSR
jgi:excisionase family DNA binding protein